VEESSSRQLVSGRLFTLLLSSTVLVCCVSVMLQALPRVSNHQMRRSLSVEEVPVSTIIPLPQNVPSTEDSFPLFP